MRLFFDLGELSTLGLGKGKGGKKGKLAGKNFLALLQQNQGKDASALKTLKNGKVTTLGMFSERGLSLPAGKGEKLKTLKLKSELGEIELPKTKAQLKAGLDKELKLVKGERGWMVEQSNQVLKKGSDQKGAEINTESDAESLFAEKTKVNKRAAKGKASVEGSEEKSQVLREPTQPDTSEEVLQKQKLGKQSSPEQILVVGQAEKQTKNAADSGKANPNASLQSKGVKATASQNLGQGSSAGIIDPNVGAGTSGVVLSPEDIAQNTKTVHYDVSWRWRKGGRNTGQPVPERTSTEDLVGLTKKIKAKNAEAEHGKVKLGDKSETEGIKVKTQKGLPEHASDFVNKDVLAEQKGKSEETKAKVGQQSHQDKGDVYRVRQHVPRRGNGQGVVETPTPTGSEQSGKQELSQQQIAQIMRDLPKTGKSQAGSTTTPNFSAKQAHSEVDAKEMLAKLKQGEGFAKIPKMPSSKMASWIAAHRESIQSHQVQITDVQREVVFDKSKPQLTAIKGQPILNQPTFKGEGKATQEASQKAIATDAKLKQTPVETALKEASTQAKEPVKTSVSAALNTEGKDKKVKSKVAATQAVVKPEAAKATHTPQAVQATTEQGPMPKTQSQGLTAFAATTHAAEAPEHVIKLGVEERSLTSAMDKAQAKANLGSLRATVNETAQPAVTNTAVHQSTMSADIPRDSEGLPQPMFRDLEAQLAKAVRVRPNAVSLKLSPESLGEVRIRVIRRGEQLQAKIQAENPQTAELITENQSKLDERLREQGIEISEFEVYSENAMDHGSNDQQSGWERQAEYAMRSEIISGDPWGRVSESLSEREAALHEADEIKEISYDGESDAEETTSETDVELTV